MTTIGPMIHFATASQFTGMTRSASNTTFAGQVDQATTQTNEAQSDTLTDLLVKLKELKRQEVNMSPTDYLSASLALNEQISTERLNAGEDLDVFGVRFEGRVSKLAGKLNGPGSLEALKAPDSKAGNLSSYQLARPNGVDIKA